MSFSSSRETSVDENLSKRLSDCVNLQTNVIQHLSQYSQHITLQLIDIKKNVELLENQIMILQQQQSTQSLISNEYNQIWMFPSVPSFFYHPTISPPSTVPQTLSLSQKPDEPPSLSTPFIFRPLNTYNSVHDNVSSTDTFSSDIIFINEIRPTFEQMERARKLQLPPSFYLYENKQPCKGCRGCNDDSVPFSSYEASYPNITKYLNPNNLISGNMTNFPSAFFRNSSISSSTTPTWNFDETDPLHVSRRVINSSPPKNSRVIIKAKRCLPNNRVPPPPPSLSSCEQSSTESYGNDEAPTFLIHQKKSKNFRDSRQNSSQNSSTKSVETVLEKTTDTGSNDKTNHLIVDGLTSINSLNDEFPFTLADSTMNLLAKTLSTSKEDEKLFSDLTKQLSEYQFSKDNESTGQGSMLLNRTSSNQSDTETASIDDDHEDDYEPNITFTPIVRLLPVEVKTGEEDENVLFCQRAQLYRFDEMSNEMKERGVGEIKILQHKIKNSCRILMRREKIFKICANHMITSKIELIPNEELDNSYIWSAIDYSDQKEKLEKFCIEFKTNEQAKHFFRQVNDAKQINTNKE